MRTLPQCPDSGLFTEPENHSREAHSAFTRGSRSTSPPLPWGKLRNGDFQTLDCNPFICRRLKILPVVTVITHRGERGKKKTKRIHGTWSVSRVERANIASRSPFPVAGSILSRECDAFLTVSCCSEKLDTSGLNAFFFFSFLVGG